MIKILTFLILLLSIPLLRGISFAQTTTSTSTSTSSSSSTSTSSTSTTSTSSTDPSFSESYQANCTTISQHIAPADNSRNNLFLINHSSAAVTICFHTTCTSTTGVLLVQNATIVNSTYRGPVSCISGSSSTVGVLSR